MSSDISKTDALVAVSAVSETNIFERMKVYCKASARERRKNMPIEDDAIKTAQSEKLPKRTVTVSPDDSELRRISESSSPVVYVERNPAIEEKLEQFRLLQQKQKSLSIQTSRETDSTSSTVLAEFTKASAPSSQETIPKQEESESTQILSKEVNSCLPENVNNFARKTQVVDTDIEPASTHGHTLHSECPDLKAVGIREHPDEIPYRKKEGSEGEVDRKEAGNALPEVVASTSLANAIIYPPAQVYIQVVYSENRRKSNRKAKQQTYTTKLRHILPKSESNTENATNDLKVVDNSAISKESYCESNNAETNETTCGVLLPQHAGAEIASEAKRAEEREKEVFDKQFTLAPARPNTMAVIENVVSDLIDTVVGINDGFYNVYKAKQMYAESIEDCQALSATFDTNNANSGRSIHLALNATTENIDVATKPGEQCKANTSTDKYVNQNFAKAETQSELEDIKTGSTAIAAECDNMSRHSSDTTESIPEIEPTHVQPPEGTHIINFQNVVAVNPNDIRAVDTVNLSETTAISEECHKQNSDIPEKISDDTKPAYIANLEELAATRPEILSAFVGGARMQNSYEMLQEEQWLLREAPVTPENLPECKEMTLNIEAADTGESAIVNSNVDQDEDISQQSRDITENANYREFEKTMTLPHSICTTTGKLSPKPRPNIIVSLPLENIHVKGIGYFSPRRETRMGQRIDSSSSDVGEAIIAPSTLKKDERLDNLIQDLSKAVKEKQELHSFKRKKQVNGRRKQLSKQNKYHKFHKQHTLAGQQILGAAVPTLHHGQTNPYFLAEVKKEPLSEAEHRPDLDLKDASETTTKAETSESPNDNSKRREKKRQGIVKVFQTRLRRQMELTQSTTVTKNKQKSKLQKMIQSYKSQMSLRKPKKEADDNETKGTSIHTNKICKICDINTVGNSSQAKKRKITLKPAAQASQAKQQHVCNQVERLTDSDTDYESDLPEIFPNIRQRTSKSNGETEKVTNQPNMARSVELTPKTPNGQLQNNSIIQEHSILVTEAMSQKDSLQPNSSCKADNSKCLTETHVMPGLSATCISEVEESVEMLIKSEDLRQTVAGSENSNELDENTSSMKEKFSTESGEAKQAHPMMLSNLDNMDNRRNRQCESRSAMGRSLKTAAVEIVNSQIEDAQLEPLNLSVKSTDTVHQSTKQPTDTSNGTWSTKESSVNSGNISFTSTQLQAKSVSSYSMHKLKLHFLRRSIETTQSCDKEETVTLTSNSANNEQSDEKTDPLKLAIQAMDEDKTADMESPVKEHQNIAKPLDMDEDSKEERYLLSTVLKKFGCEEEIHQEMSESDRITQRQQEIVPTDRVSPIRECTNSTNQNQESVVVPAAKKKDFSTKSSLPGKVSENTSFPPEKTANTSTANNTVTASKDKSRLLQMLRDDNQDKGKAISQPAVANICTNPELNANVPSTTTLPSPHRSSTSASRLGQDSTESKLMQANITHISNAVPQGQPIVSYRLPLNIPTLETPSPLSALVANRLRLPMHMDVPYMHNRISTPANTNQSLARFQNRPIMAPALTRGRGRPQKQSMPNPRHSFAQTVRQPNQKTTSLMSPANHMNRAPRLQTRDYVPSALQVDSTHERESFQQKWQQPVPTDGPVSQINRVSSSIQNNPPMYNIPPQHSEFPDNHPEGYHNLRNGPHAQPFNLHQAHYLHTPHETRPFDFDVHINKREVPSPRQDFTGPNSPSQTMKLDHHERTVYEKIKHEVEHLERMQKEAEIEMERLLKCKAEKLHQLKYFENKQMIKQMNERQSQNTQRQNNFVPPMIPFIDLTEEERNRAAELAVQKALNETRRRKSVGPISDNRGQIYGMPKTNPRFSYQLQHINDLQNNTKLRENYLPLENQSQPNMSLSDLPNRAQLEENLRRLENSHQVPPSVAPVSNADTRQPFPNQRQSIGQLGAMCSSAQGSVSPYGRDSNSFKKPDIPATYGHQISPSIRKLVTDRPNSFASSMSGPRQPIIAPAPGLYRAVNPDISEPPAKQMRFEVPGNHHISSKEAPDYLPRQHRDIYINMLPKEIETRSGHQLNARAQAPKVSRNTEPLDKGPYPNFTKPQLVMHENVARMPPEMPGLHYQNSTHQQRTMQMPTSYQENKQLPSDSLHRTSSHEHLGNMSQHQHNIYTKPGSSAPWIDSNMRERHLSQERFPWKHLGQEMQQKFHQHYHSGLELEQNKICILCNKPAQYLCSGCESEWYCSMSCQKSNWERHKAKCHSRQQEKSAIQSVPSIDNSQLLRRS